MKRIFLFIIMLLLAVSAVAQEENKVSIPVEIRFGDTTYKDVVEVTWTVDNSTTLDAYARVNESSAVLRSEPSISSASKGTLLFGTRMEVSMKATENGSTWYYVTGEQNGESFAGYVKSDLVTIISYEDYMASNGSSSDSDDEVSGVIKIISTVNLREGPGTTYDKVGTADVGNIYTYVDYENGFYKLSNGYWIDAKYATTEINWDTTGDNGVSYKEGDVSSMVSVIQQWLQTLGYYTGTADGTFGASTKNAVVRFQGDNDLVQDGIVGETTLRKLQEKVAGSSSYSVHKTVYRVDWFNAKVTSGCFSTIGFVAGKEGTLTDLTTGITLNILIQSAGNHIDAEPLTTTDTARFCAIYGVASASSITSSRHYQRRPMLLTIGSYQFVCSMYGVPHGQQKITTNGYPGQFCLHFTNSRTSGSNKVDSGHQTAISNAESIVLSKGGSIKTIPPTP